MQNGGCGIGFWQTPKILMETWAFAGLDWKISSSDFIGELDDGTRCRNGDIFEIGEAVFSPKKQFYLDCFLTQFFQAYVSFLMRVLVIFSVALLLQCAFPHRYTIGDIDNTSSKRKHFQIMVSELGYNFEEGLTIAQGALYASNSEANMESIRDIEYVKTAIALSTMGPVTGRKVFNGKYADELTNIIYQHCKSGKIVNLQNIRESAKYPVVSGEIVRIEGDCLE